MMGEPLVLTPPLAQIPPVLFRWVGAKGWLASHLASRLLPLLARGGRYFEPFAGSLRLYFTLRAHGWRGPALLSDVLTPLVAAYRGVRKAAHVVAQALAELAADEADMEREGLYYVIRELFNAHLPGRPGYRPACPYQAARFIYLNLRCFNALCRTNQSGEMNAPWGGERTRPLPSLAFLQEVATALEAAELRDCDFEEALLQAGPGAVVYADPPYDGAFVGYAASFSDADQERLRDALLACYRRGAAVYASNASSPLIRRLYNGAPWRIEELKTVYRVGGPKGSRKATTELLITTEGRSI